DLLLAPRTRSLVPVGGHFPNRRSTPAPYPVHEARSGRIAQRRAKLGAWMCPEYQLDGACSAESARGGGTVMGPTSRSSSAGARRARVCFQRKGASSR